MKRLRNVLQGMQKKLAYFIDQLKTSQKHRFCWYLIETNTFDMSKRCTSWYYIKQGDQLRRNVDVLSVT